MTWLTWRQHRLEALSASLIVITFLLIVTGLLIAGQPVFDQIRRACPSGDSACTLATDAFSGFATANTVLYLALLALPLLSGLFIGSPLLAREYEHGTDQLAWSQGITRRRWLFVKLALLGAGILCIAGILATAGGRWSAALPASMTNQWYAFDTQGPEFVAYAFFSFAAGVAASASIGKTVPAMAAAVAAFVAARMAIAFLARPNFQPPLVADVSGGLFTDPQGQEWLLGAQRHVDLRGNPVSDAAFSQAYGACVNGQPTQPLGPCLHEHGVQVLQAFQPADRFPLFQGIETAIFVVAAVALLGLAAWLVSRRS
jgi:hypothetical protein